MTAPTTHPMLTTLLLLLGSMQTRLIPVAAEESLAVTDAGAGPAVVLIPGLLGSGFAFRGVTPRLNAEAFRTIVIEPLGVGGSSRPEQADYSLQAQADRVAAVLDTLDVQSTYIVSHAVGSAIALRLARWRPDLVLGIVSLEGGAAESATTPGFRRAMKLAPVIKLLGVGFLRGKLKKQLLESTGDPGWVTDDVVDGYLADAARDLGAALRAYGAMSHSREPELLAPQLSEIRCPVLLLLGGAAHSGGPASEEIALLADRVPAFRVDTLPVVGHFPHEEAPGAVVDALLRVHATATYLAALFRPDERH